MSKNTILLVYYSSRTENTHRFVEKLGFENTLRLQKGSVIPEIGDKFILICPSYGGGSKKGCIPSEVYGLLNNKLNRENLAGVIGSGNTNFGTAYCQSAKMISEKCCVPLLYMFELMGSATDVINVKQGVENFGKD